MPFEALRGFRDYLPPDAGARSHLLEAMRGAARRAGFQELEIPSVESLELYRVKSGEGIGEEVWGFPDKGGRPVALVPESTPSLARIFAARAKSEALPVKWFTVSKIWRYEEPQSGRTREFVQFNLDLLGAGGAAADTEILAAAAMLLDAAGAAGLYELRLNDRNLAEGLGRGLGATDPGRFFRALDRSRKESAAWLEEELEAVGLPAEARALLGDLVARSRAGVGPADAADFLDRIAAMGLPEPAPAGLARLRELLSLLGRVGIADRVLLDLTIVRGLAYYTGPVFEAFPKGTPARALLGGGRYDRLIELFGGPPTPACGFALGDQTLEILLRSAGRWPEGEPPLDAYVVAVTAGEVPLAIEWVARLRRAGVAADFDPMGRSMSGQLREASRRKARRALLLGPRELARGVVLERDLETGAQRERAPEEVLAGG